MARKIQKTLSYLTTIVGPEAAHAPQDGGKWALLCLHREHGADDWTVGGQIQDTNKTRLAGWGRSRDERGYTTWCDECQDKSSAES